MEFLLSPPRSRLRRREDNPWKYLTPPLDGSLTVSELYDFHYEENPDHPVFVYANQSGLTRLAFGQVVPASYIAARFIAKALALDLESPDHSRPTVGILAMTGKEIVRNPQAWDLFCSQVIETLSHTLRHYWACYAPRLHSS
jgi:hypothetical protein